MKHHLLAPSQRGLSARKGRLGECPIVRCRGQRFQRKASSLGRGCHAFWRDGCGAYRLLGATEIRTGSPPHPAPPGPPSPAGEGLTLRNRPRTSELRLLLQGKPFLRSTGPVSPAGACPSRGGAKQGVYRILHRNLKFDAES